MRRALDKADSVYMMEETLTPSPIVSSQPLNYIEHSP